MRIKIKTARWSYPGGSHVYGEWVEVTPEVARQLVDSKQAEAVDPFPVIKPVEKPKGVEALKKELEEATKPAVEKLAKDLDKIGKTVAKKSE